MSHIEKVISIIKQKHPHLIENKPFDLNTTGSANDVMIIDKDGPDPRVFRFPKEGHKDAHHHILLEQLIMPRLINWVPHIPQYDIIENDPIPYVSYPMIVGDQLKPPLSTQVPEDKLSSISKHVATVLYGIHLFPGSAYFPIELSKSEYFKFHWKQHYKTIIKYVCPYLEHRQNQWIAWLYESFLNDDRNFQFQPCFINGDMKKDHIIIDPKSYQFKGIIDLGLKFGDPAMDFGYIRLGESFMYQLLQHYKGDVNGTFVQRARFYQFTVPLTGLLIGFTQKDQTYIQISLNQLNHSIQESQF
ncbi:phosphotransferase family protein [Paenibacillus sp. S-38]|uniref:phosphotransferase family protein n=1 Tax=Paenibacillus sp. S-38 TaxID=3416710 RepID=UPI003CF81540